ncbi:phosphotransferase-like protein [Amycolatopsis silviterrae]|uniref:Chloramphenicol phosphotransferase n=1 Tax=Amycolatopsis silviterrae TaxID=1656914 RepID=A0ABW5HBG6_9PSEU
MSTEVILLNGGSSSGKSGIVRCLQAVLPDPWLALGTDTLVAAMPASMRASNAGIEFAPDGQVIVGPEFRTLEAAWIEGVAAMARAGARAIGMAASQAEVVHRGMVYDVEVDTTRTESLECARTIAAQVS